MESAFQLAAKARSAEAPDPPIRLEAHIDEVTEDGRVIGWASRPGHVARLHIGIFQGGRLIAVAVTQGYRADLLAAGHSLGHCAFAARLREVPEPGRCELGLTLLALPAVTRRFPVNVPTIRRPAAAIPAAPPARWTDEDILQHLHRFALPAQLAALGPARLVDGTCQFVLGRWATASMIEAARRKAAAGALDPDDFVRDLIASDERRALAEPLPTPFDPRFPFTYPCAAPAG